MPNPFNSKDWYWIVNGSTAQVFSSKSGDYVPVANPTYQAWLTAGNLPTRIASEAELGEVLGERALRPLNAGVLDAYKDSQASKITIEALAKIVFYLVNEVKALKGEAAVTPAGFKNFIASKL